MANEGVSEAAVRGLAGASKFVIAARARDGHIWYWIGHGWTDSPALAKGYPDAVAALVGFGECKGQPHEPSHVLRV